MRKKFLLLLLSGLAMVAQAKDDNGFVYDVDPEVRAEIEREDAQLEQIGYQRDSVDMHEFHCGLLLEYALNQYYDHSYGLSFFVMKRWGAYVGVHFNGWRSSEDVYVDESGRNENGMKEFLNGKDDRKVFNVGAGVTFRAWPYVTLYLGAGYGFRRLLWQTEDERWLRNKEASVEGLQADFGAIANANNFLVKVGISTTKFKNQELRVGLGVRF